MHRFAPWLPAAALTALIMMPSSMAAEPADAPSPDDTELFVIGNTLFTLYHELGHALIDLLDLPVVGREEDAADGFAAVTMIPDQPDPLRDALIVAVADGWRLQSDMNISFAKRTYWGEHALDEQRYFAIVCLMVGSDQEGFYDFALEAGLPEDRIHRCRKDYARTQSGWSRLLAPHRSTSEPSGHGEGASVDLIFEEPRPEQRETLALIRRHDVLEDAVDRFAANVVLPAAVTVRFSTCGEANAYWASSGREVIVCYELIREFEEILLGTAVR